MKIAALSLLLSSAAAWDKTAPVNHPDIIDKLNEEADTWVAGKNAFFEGWTVGDVQSLLGAELLSEEERLFDVAENTHQKFYDSLGDNVPTDFDSRVAFAGLIAPIRDQAQCGSCWAFSAVEVLTDRFAIQTNSSSSPVLSPQDMVACDTADSGCGGGRLPTAWDYMKKTGVVTDTCVPYTSQDGTVASCPTKCTGTGDFTKYKAATSYSVKGVANMQKEIMTNGPIQTAFMVYRSFMSYTSGVYKKKFYEIIPEGGHAVKIIGWGTESGTDYWLVANSWTETWGDAGTFKILRGKDQCGIESTGPPYAGMAAV